MNFRKLDRFKRITSILLLSTLCPGCIRRNVRLPVDGADRDFVKRTAGNEHLRSNDDIHTRNERFYLFSNKFSECFDRRHRRSVQSFFFERLVFDQSVISNGRYCFCATARLAKKKKNTTRTHTHTRLIQWKSSTRIVYGERCFIPQQCSNTKLFLPS